MATQIANTYLNVSGSRDALTEGSPFQSVH